VSDWVRRAACRPGGEHADPELWFPLGKGPETRAQVEEATAICRECPVRVECLEYALEHKVPDGIWGGVTELGRWKILLERRAVGPTRAHAIERELRRAAREELEEKAS
jgi:WhiB family redox-sensing transcriptional regulator